ncbi:MAG: WD40 repeat domain-containing serine/threonine-protein kinase [Planctomycetota bacterium]
MNRSGADDELLLIDSLVEKFLAGNSSSDETSEPKHIQRRIDAFVADHPNVAERLRRILETVAVLEMPPIDEDRLGGTTNDRLQETNESFPVIPDFKIRRKLGVGGMGIVFKASQMSLDRDVALKVIPNLLLDSDLAVRRFEIECRAAAQLQHPHIVPIYDVGHANHVHFYTMQLIRGSALDLVIARLRRQHRGDRSIRRHVGLESIRIQDALPSPNTSSMGEEAGHTQSTSRTTLSGTRGYYQQVAAIGRDVAAALAHAHANGVIHRDVKPSNLLLDRNGKVWLTDFGLAKTGDNDLTQTGDVVGTLRFMAPERLDGLCDRRSDVYSLGATLYELAGLQPAFSGDGQLSLLRCIRDHNVQPLRTLEPRFPRDLETIIAKAMAGEPGDRYQTAEAFSEDLQRFIDGRPILAVPPTPGQTFLRWVRRNPALSSAVAVVAVLLLVGLVGSVYAAIGFRSAAIEQGRLTRRAGDAESEARRLASENRRNLYSAEMLLANAAAEDPLGGPRLDELLEAYAGPSDHDLVGFEWHWLRRIVRPPTLSLARQVAGADQASAWTDPLKELDPSNNPQGQQLRGTVKVHPSRAALIAAVGNRLQVSSTLDDQIIRVFASDRDSVVQTLDVSSETQTDGADRGRILLVRDSGEVELLDAETGQLLHRRHVPQARAAAFDEAGNVLVISGDPDSEFTHAIEQLSAVDLQPRHRLSSEDPAAENSIPWIDGGGIQLTESFAFNEERDQLMVASNYRSWTGLCEFRRIDGVWRFETEHHVHEMFLSSIIHVPPTSSDKNGTRDNSEKDRWLLATYNGELIDYDAFSKTIRNRVRLSSFATAMYVDAKRNQIEIGDNSGGLQTFALDDLNAVGHSFHHRTGIAWIGRDPSSGDRISVDFDANAIRWLRGQPPMRRINLAVDARNGVGHLTWSPRGLYLAAGIGARMHLFDREGNIHVVPETLPDGKPDDGIFAAEPIGWTNQSELLSYFREYLYRSPVDSTRLPKREQRLPPLNTVLDEQLLAVPGCDWIFGLQRSKNGWRLVRREFVGDTRWSGVTNWRDSETLTDVRMHPSGKAAAICTNRPKQVGLISWEPLPEFPSLDTGTLCFEIPFLPIETAFAPDDNALAVVGTNASVALYGMSDYRLISELNGHDGRVLSVDWSIDSRRVATGGEDGRLIIWDTTSARPVLMLEHDHPVIRVRWSPDGRRLAFLTRDGKLHLLVQ